MERIASFSVDHRVLEPGVYVSRRDSDDTTGCTTTTFDLRMTAPNREPVMDTAAVHAIDLGADPASDERAEATSRERLAILDEIAAIVSAARVA